MKVYLLEESQAYEGTYNQKIFAKLKDAKDAAQAEVKHKLKWQGNARLGFRAPYYLPASTYSVWFYITEFEVQ